MKERSEYKGVWFLPNNPNCRIGGILNQGICNRLVIPIDDDYFKYFQKTNGEKLMVLL